MPAPPLPVPGPEEDRDLLHGLVVFAQRLLQIRHPDAEALDHVQHERLVHEIRRRLFVHGPAHPADVVLIAVVEHRERVQIVHDAQREVERDIPAAERALLRGVVDRRAVGEDVIAEKGELPQRGRDAAQDATRRRDEQHAPLRRRLQRAEILLRDPFLVVEQRSVQVERDQSADHGVPSVPGMRSYSVLLWRERRALARFFLFSASFSRHGEDGKNFLCRFSDLLLQSCAFSCIVSTVLIRE